MKCDICGNDIHNLDVHDIELLNNALPDKFYKCMQCLTIIYGINTINNICKQLAINRWISFYSNGHYVRIAFGYDDRIVNAQYAKGYSFIAIPSLIIGDLEGEKIAAIIKIDKVVGKIRS